MIGEGVALTVALLSLIPILPVAVAEAALPIAVAVGAGALFIVGLSDTFDTTRPPIILIENLGNSPVPPDGTIEIVLDPSSGPSDSVG